MRAIKIILFVLGVVLLTAIGFLFAFGHMFSAGTHGSIKSYEYPVSKENLEDAINKIILENNSLYRPSQDTIDFNSETDYYNHDGYIRLSIIAPDTFNYIFRFAGDEENWKNNSNYSSIFICYAYDNKGNGGSEGTGGIEWYRWGVKKKLTKYYEKNFIDKIDKQLEVNHIEKN